MMRRPRVRTRGADPLAPAAFAAFTLFGCAYIVVAKYFHLNPFIVTTGPVALMIVYAGLILSFRGLRLRDDQTADNFYYMGFIFTLASLAISLFQYSGGGAVDEIIRNFGVAVASTITGIALRIFFNQTRRDPIEIEQATRLELADAAAKVRRELSGISTEMAHFRRANEQMLTEAFSEIGNAVEKSVRDTLESMDKLVKEAVERSREIAANVNLAELHGQVEQVSAEFKAMASNLKSSGKSIDTASKALTQKLGAMMTPDKVIEVRLEPVVAGLQRAIELSMAQLDSRLHEVGALREALEDNTAKLMETHAQLIAMSDDIGGRSSWNPMSFFRKQRSNKRYQEPDR